MTKSSQPKLLLLSMGGTWSMKEGGLDGGEAALCPEALGPGYRPQDEFPELGTFADVAFLEVASVDSTNLVPADWAALAAAIAQRRGAFDGFVVAMGTDTLEFAAAAMAFALQGIGRPVVVTGAQVSKSEPGSDARCNIVNACRLAALRRDDGCPLIREVVVVFGSRILRATRCRKFSERDLDAFDTVNAPVLGRFGTAVRIHQHLLLPQDSPFRPAPAFDPNVWLLPLFPGLNPDAVRAIATGASGLVLAGFGAGNIPSGIDAARRGNALENVIRECTERAQPVVVTTRCVVGQAEGVYATGHAARRVAIIANDMTPECAFVKLSWVLGNLDNPDVMPRDARRARRGGPGRLGMVRKAMLAPLAGEITDNATMKATNCRRATD